MAVIVSIAPFLKVTDFSAISSGTWGHCGLIRINLAPGSEWVIRSMGQWITLGVLNAGFRLEVIIHPCKQFDDNPHLFVRKPTIGLCEQTPGNFCKISLQKRPFFG